MNTCVYKSIYICVHRSIHLTEKPEYNRNSNMKWFYFSLIAALNCYVRGLFGHTPLLLVKTYLKKISSAQFESLIPKLLQISSPFSLQHRFDPYFKRLAEVSASRLLLELLSFLPLLGQKLGCHFLHTHIHFRVSGSSWRGNGEKTRTLATCL